VYAAAGPGFCEGVGLIEAGVVRGCFWWVVLSWWKLDFDGERSRGTLGNWGLLFFHLLASS
jgi:hypothetical protein